MGRKLDPTKEKRGPGRKARKQKGAETELVRFLPAVSDENSKRPNHCLESYQKGSLQELSRQLVRRDPSPYLMLLEARSAQHLAVMRKRRRKTLKKMVW
ncbi:NOP2 nucleolar protein [Homo sapiens]|uniref:NOP2 nucleolar protein n=1 Tax=Homo sapiens TaxID=9606 RepID=F5H8G6_HUMAN|nr:NOP2 nucleolar protein [Homo sapiens]KAI4064242.1 NOP2 nucleolar protein [Homo sapiens]